MKLHGGFIYKPPQPPPCKCVSPSPELHLRHQFNSRRNFTLLVRCTSAQTQNATRRSVLLTPLLALGASVLLQSSASSSKAEPSSPPPPAPPSPAAGAAAAEINSRIYDATVIGEPMAVGKDKRKVWEKLTNARIVYLGEAEQVPVKDDKELELEIFKNLTKRCVENEKSISLAMEMFPCDLQPQVNQFIDGRIDGETLKSYLTHWPVQGWQEYEPLLNYCRDNRVRIVACGTPLKVIRTVQAEGIRGLPKADRKLYAPPAGSGFISGFTSISRRSIDMNYPYQSVPFGPSSYLSAQARVVEDYTMSQIILQAVADGGATGMLVVVTGASHVMYGPRGTGLPARISKKMQKKNQVVILLDPERQSMRREGEVPVADFLWYSAARPCSRNCFDRAEIARVMNAAGRRRDALPQDLQKGLDLGLVSPEVLQNFFDLEQYPLLKELTHRFQGFRERLLADPKFLHRLAIEEAISMTTTLLAQYERRKENFFEELDYVITDTVRGTVVDFFTVWLPAPTLSFLSYADETSVPDNIDALKGLLGSIPDNAFQKTLPGKDWNLNHRLASVLFGGLKLSSVGFISSIGAVAASNTLYTIRKFLNPALVTDQRTRRSPILKTALVYSCFLGTSANLRYQIIAGLIEHRISDEFSSQTLLVNMLSFIVRTINSYWGTQQWVDLARFSGLQSKKDKPSSSYQALASTTNAIDGSNTSENAGIDEIKNH
ncbi:protein RETICULATA-RELATED 6, chloroplastic isoform X1 [Ricinus communis]|uniref:protein RETICULATA-RELATED 6, chloroplastic isoform X1 n=1 Tax=Ricinus communis TaxID=3988 RepID=UPI00201A5E03|nr:protein RETICULATA-RELATED 6, chloroplastic isoform X1 [Ricinus communis]